MGCRKHKEDLIDSVVNQLDELSSVTLTEVLVTQILVPAIQKWVVTYQLRTTDLESDEIDDFWVKPHSLREAHACFTLSKHIFLFIA